MPEKEDHCPLLIKTVPLVSIVGYIDCRTFIGIVKFICKVAYPVLRFLG